MCTNGAWSSPVIFAAPMSTAKSAQVLPCAVALHEVWAFGLPRPFPSPNPLPPADPLGTQIPCDPSGRTEIALESGYTYAQGAVGTADMGLAASRSGQTLRVYARGHLSLLSLKGRHAGAMDRRAYYGMQFLSSPSHGQIFIVTSRVRCLGQRGHVGTLAPTAFG